MAETYFKDLTSITAWTSLQELIDICRSQLDSCLSVPVLAYGPEDGVTDVPQPQILYSCDSQQP